jgi:hypothetical protein
VLVVDSDENLDEVFNGEMLRDMLVVQSAEIFAATTMKVGDGTEH